MKKTFLIIAILFLSVTFLSTNIYASNLKVAMLLPGPISDHGWNMMAYEALKNVESELDVEIAYNENTSSSEYESIFRGYAAAGYDVVIGHGFEFGNAAKKVAQQYKDTSFLITSSNVTQKPNVASFRMNDAQSGFFQGVIASLLTEKNKVGTIGGQEIPPIINQQKGFKAGVEYIDSNIDITSTYTGSFKDVAKAKEMAKAMIENDIDVIISDADDANLGIIEAAKETKNVMIIGSSGDLGNRSPDVVVTSLVENFSKGISKVVKEVQRDDFKAEVYEIGIKDNAITIAPYRAFKDKLSKKDKKTIDELVKKVKNGEIKLEKYLEY